MDASYMHKHFLALSFLFFVLILGSFFSKPFSQETRAISPAATGELKGFAWSSNIGWISFNCASETSPCPHGNASGYQVKVATSTGLLSGYAWSPNVGWISFNSVSPNDLSGCPLAPCEARLSTTVVSGRRQLTGWAKVLSASGGSGWDGFISLSPKTGAPLNESNSYSATASCVNYAGTAGCYGPRMAVSTGNSTGTFSGFAWGGDVVGWVDFWGGATTTGVALVVPAPPNASTTFSAEPLSVVMGNTTTLTWLSEYAESCTATSTDSTSSWNTSVVSSATSTGSSQPIVNMNTTYTFQCNPGSVSKQVTVTATEPPVDAGSFGLSATPSTVAVSFVSNKKETTTKTVVKVVPDAGFSDTVNLSLVHNAGAASAEEIAAIGQVQPRACWGDRNDCQTTASLTSAEYNAGTPVGKDLYIEFQCTASNKCAPAAGDYHFKVHGESDGEVPATLDAEIIVRVQSFIPSFQEQ